MSTNFLILGGILSAGVALLHVVIIFYGAPALRYFGAGETLAGMAERGSIIPSIVTAGIAGVFFVFAAYALAAAGLVDGLPYVFWVTFGASAIYSLRGLMAFGGLFIKISKFDLVSSLVSLAIGIVHFLGLYWNRF